VSDNITTSTIVGASCGILVLIFVVQPLGVTKLASTFAPIVIIWLLFNFSFGVYVSGPPTDSWFEHRADMGELEPDPL
jgi:K+ transporter